MRRIFVDTSHHVAILDRSDDRHDVAVRVSASLQSDVVFVTSDAVVIELLTYFSGWGRDARRAAVEYVGLLRADSSVVVHPSSSSLMDAALGLYARRDDKSYSMVDCLSMVICRRDEIRMC